MNNLYEKMRMEGRWRHHIAWMNHSIFSLRGEDIVDILPSPSTQKIKEQTITPWGGSYSYLYCSAMLQQFPFSVIQRILFEWKGYIQEMFRHD